MRMQIVLDDTNANPDAQLHLSGLQETKEDVAKYGLPIASQLKQAEMAKTEICHQVFKC